MIALLKYWKLILGAVLIVLLASLWLLYRGQVAEVGRLQTLNTELSRSLAQAEVDKERLQATVEGNAKLSEADSLKQQEIQQQVTQLNKTIAQLKSSNNILKKKANGSNQACQSDGSDLELSDDLRLQLESVYKGSGTSQSSKYPSSKPL